MLALMSGGAIDDDDFVFNDKAPQWLADSATKIKPLLPDIADFDTRRLEMTVMLKASKNDPPSASLTGSLGYVDLLKMSLPGPFDNSSNNNNNNTTTNINSKYKQQLLQQQQKQQTNKQTHKQTNKQSSKQKQNKQTNKKSTNKHTNKQTNKQTHKQTN